MERPIRYARWLNDRDVAERSICLTLTERLNDSANQQPVDVIRAPRSGILAAMAVRACVRSRAARNGARRTLLTALIPE